MEAIRVRLLFEDKDGILSDTQKSDGLERCWVLLKPQQHQTITDLADHILRAFQLRPSCPHGILLYMDGFALPWFESTAILKDQDVVSVRKKGITYALEGNNASNLVTGLDATQNHTVQTGALLLANEEFGKETGGYQSDEPEDESEEEDLIDGSKEGDGKQDTLHNSSQINVNSKKRKAGQSLQGSKEKKKKRSEIQGSSEDDISAKVSKLKKKSSRKKAEVDDGSTVATPILKSSDQTPQNGEQLEEASGEKEKRPSRSARRKKAKRQWIREMAKIQKKNSDSKTKEVQNWKEKSGRAEVKKHNNWKQKPAKFDAKEDNGQPKGLLYWKQLSQGETSKDKRSNGDTNLNGNVSNQSNQKHDLYNEVVPVVIKPGHIRFEPLDKEKDVVQNQIPEACNQVPEEPRVWNGINSKRKGQKWGTERNSFSRRSNYKDTGREGPKTLVLPKDVHLNGPIDFEKLPVLSDLPMVGDVIAYRVLELTSSWTPEVSSFRVGHVSWCNDKSGKLILMQIPGYPIVSKNSEEEPDQQPDSLYKEDGSLEIGFSALIDVRVIKNSNEGSAKAVTDKVTKGPIDVENATPATAEKQPNSSTPETVQANGEKQANGSEKEVNVWEQLSQELSAKKEELSEIKTWENASSGRGTWSYGALRRSALAPTMAYLRSKNQL